MTTPITPSLSHLLNPQAAPPRPAAQGGGFASALAAQKAFFQQVTAPKMTPEPRLWSRRGMIGPGR